MTGSVHEITACRLCGSTDLRAIVDLGRQPLSGVFPRDRDRQLTVGPLELVACGGACGLVQLRHGCALDEMYGDNYGYRSGLNRAMVAHLAAKARAVVAHAPLAPGDIVVDIGSNDGTLLSFFPAHARRIGIDPTVAKFAKFYQPGIETVADFFTAARFRALAGGARAKIVTSISMFYDLERPLDFARDVHDVLADDGIWHFEQSYLPAMLAANAYDTICHEHLEYYSLAAVRWIVEHAGFSIVDVERNDVNGGSFAVTARKGDRGHAPVVARMIDDERGLPDALARFPERVAAHKRELVALLERLARERKPVFGYGASTKGNVVLNYCGITTELVSCIADVNEDKFGCFTPGTGIPIVPEPEAIARAPYAFLVLPWHFRKDILSRARPLFERGIHLLFPLPAIELVSGAE